MKKLQRVAPGGFVPSGVTEDSVRALARPVAVAAQRSPGRSCPTSGLRGASPYVTALPTMAAGQLPLA